MRSLLLALSVLTCWGAVAVAEPVPVDATWPCGTGPVLDLAFSPDGQTLAGLGDDGKVRLWNVAGHQLTHESPAGIEGQNVVRFTRDGKNALILGLNDTILRMDVPSGKSDAIALHSVPGGTSAFDVSPDGKQLAVVGRGSVRILSAADGSELKSWEVHPLYAINAVAFSPDGKLVATASTEHKADVVDWASGKIVWECPLPLNGTAVAFSPDGKTLFAASSDSTLKAFDLATGEGKTLIDQKVTIRNLVPSPDGKMLIVGGTGRKPWAVKLPGGETDETPFAGDGWNKCVAVSPDGQWAAGGANDGTVSLWKLK